MCGDTMRKIPPSEYLGKKYGRWMILFDAIDPRRHPRVVAQCDCGEVHSVDKGNVLYGVSTGCSRCGRKAGSQNPNWKGHIDIPANLFGILKKSAEVRNIAVDVTMQDLQEAWDIQGGRCAISGMPIFLGGKEKGYTASVDRIRQQEGYTKSNIQWVHKDVNLMKNRFSEDYFFAVCEHVVAYRRSQMKAAA